MLAAERTKRLSRTQTGSFMWIYTENTILIKVFFTFVRGESARLGVIYPPWSLRGDQAVVDVLPTLICTRSRIWGLLVLSVSSCAISHPTWPPLLEYNLAIFSLQTDWRLLIKWSQKYNFGFIVSSRQLIDLITMDKPTTSKWIRGLILERIPNIILPIAYWTII